MVEIALPKKKRAFIKITNADNDWILLNDYKTFREFKVEYDSGRWLDSKEILTILEKYIDNGFGDDIISKHFG